MKFKKPDDTNFSAVNENRRRLLKMALSTSAILAIANTGIYVIGAAFKDLDGSLVAGAKVWVPTGHIGMGLAPNECNVTPCSTAGASGTCMDCVVGSASCADKFSAQCQ